MISPAPSSDAVARRMRATARKDTAAELALRRELHRRGLRYRVDRAVVGRRRRVDIAFSRARLAVYVDGCFWHCCPIHGSTPKNNREWWRAKLAANVARDRRSEDELVDAGYAVLRVWEHEDPVDAADRIERLVRSRLSALR